MRKLAVFLMPLLWFASDAALAQKLYRWVDREGNVHYTDTLPPEAMQSARDELNSQGMTVNRVDRALTEEERKRKAEDADRAAEAAARQAEQDKMDSVLTSSYATEGDLERAYKERFDLLDQSVEAAKVGIASQEKSLTDLLAHAARLEREGKPVPATVNDSITAARTQVAEQRAYMEMREKERTSLQNEYETVRARYRKLKGSIGADAMTD
ncbi:MAG: hypothetical protein BWZ07_02512 [Alphaproteobacteria bacterium ADurb.BinA280]|jgi:chromosome segregation ATPase|nr:DUF4124 domain-containing protein [Xanthomonadales bacterium]MCC6506039.1 DUF4124 domain-containing protein [Aquimonas sp.]OPZ10673.1 MAG: hypothetical protein BWZ07_02512 [Alphaproteobacteria bacterium ADurb.BinA280]